MNAGKTLLRALLTVLLALLLAGCAGTLGSVRGIYQAQSGDTLYKSHNYPAALVKFQEAAALDNPYACYRLYVMHQYGQGTAKDPAKATSFLEQAARLGDETSQVILGSRLLFGQKAKRAEGIRLLEAAARNENRYAYEYLALAYQHGLGVEQDSSRAKEYQRLAKTQGSGHVLTSGSPKQAGASSNLELTQSIQRELKTLGYYRGKIDGIYGPMTRDAISRFQKDRDLPLNPVVSNQLLEQVKKK